MQRLLGTVVAALLLAACSAPSDAPDTLSADAMAPETTPAPEIDLATFFNCLHQNDGAVIAAHRGGPLPGYPENAIETMQYNFDQGIRVFEIDVAETRDGVLTLMHDDRVNRTTNGSGYVSDTSWEAMSGLRLVDNSGTQTDFHPPKLTDALIWARQTGAILELDKKKTTSFKNIVSAVKAAAAENNVILISYSDDQAVEIAKIDPTLMMTASAFGERDVSALEARGVDRDRLIAWTGTRAPDIAAFARLEAAGVEPAFGTLGRPGERLDDEYLADGDGSEYAELIADGLVLLATDEPLAAAAAMDADERGLAACWK